MRDEYNDLVASILAKQSPTGLLATAANHIAERTELMRLDQQNLDVRLKNSYALGALDDVSGEGLQRKVKSFVNSELEVFQAFDMSVKFAATTNMPAQISNNKMSHILTRLLENFAEDDEAVIKLFTTEFAPEPSFYAQWPTLRTNTYWGSTRGIIYSAKQICALLAISPAISADFVTTSIFHATPWVDLSPKFVNSGSKFITKIDGKSVFSFVHGGYAFGGQRQEDLQYQFGPEDCSSILSNWLSNTNSPGVYKPAENQISTMHQLFWWRSKQKESFFIDRIEYNQHIERFCNANYESASSPITQEANYKPGDVFLLRTFAKANGNPDQNYTGGGHTGVVIDRDPDEPSKVLIFECARDMESENPETGIWGPAGCGIGSFSASYEQNFDSRIKRTMFLRPKA